MLSDGRITPDESPQAKTSKRKPWWRQNEKTERKHNNDTKKLTNKANEFGLLRISYGDEHWRSGTPGIEATDLTSSKPNYKGWVGRTASEFAVGLPRTTASDFSGDEGDFGNYRKRSECFGPAVERIDRSSLPKHELFERTSVFVCFALRTQAKPDGTEEIRTIAKQPYDCKLVPKHVD